MGYERRILRTLLSVLLVLASFVTVYGERDSNFMQQKQFRNIVPSPLIQKWRENRMGPITEEKTSNEQWRDELLSNLRNVLRKHNISPSSSSSRSRDMSAYSLGEPLESLPADVTADQLFILEGAMNSPRENYAEETSIEEEKRNGFFFGKRNGFFFGKRSGSEASATKVDDDRPKFESSGSFDKCRPCGPGRQGSCVMVGTCCSPEFGCYIFTPEAAACMTEDVSPCQLNAPSCGLGGQCVADGICCSAAEGACQLDPTCTPMLLN